MANPGVALEDLSGTIIDNRYELLQREGQGGMGAIFRARHVALESLVAIKFMLKPRNLREQERFLQEAQLASKVRHANTVYLSDFGILPDGQPYLVMEFLSGRALHDELASGPLTPLRACRIGAQIARGLQAVHEKGIVHRDLKPANIILLEQDGTRDFVKIVDFGLAHSHEVDSVLAEKQAALLASDGLSPEKRNRARLTQTGIVIGTPKYMPPEQASDALVDFRADQYTLGCVLYEMLCGQSVFPDEDMMVQLFKHLNQVPTPPHERTPQLAIPDSLSALVMRLLAKSPEERFATMREVETALQAAAERLQAPAVVARPKPTGWRRALKVAVPVLVGLVALGAVLLGYRLRGNRDVGLRAGELRELQHKALQQLRQESQAGPPELRLGAIAALGRTRDLTLRSPLQGLLADSDADVRARAAEALGLLGDRAAIPALAELLQRSAEPQVRVSTAGALARLGDERGRIALERMLVILEPAEQLRAAFLLGELRATPAREVLSAYLRSRGEQLPDAVRLDVLACLVRLGDDEALGTLREQLQANRPTPQRLAAAARLVKLRDDAGRTYLLELSSQRGREQLIAARLLASPQEAPLAGLFRQILQDRGADLAARVLAAEGLGASGQALDARLLNHQLAPEVEPPLRHAAAVAIVEIAGNDPSILSEQSLGWARGALGDRDWLIRQSAVAAIGDNTGTDAVPLLAAALKDSIVGVRRSAARALGRRPERAALAALRDALRDGDESVRTESLRSMSRIAQFLHPHGQRSADPGLSQALREVRRAGSAAEKILAAGALLRLEGGAPDAELLSFQNAKDAGLRRLLTEQLTPESSAGELALVAALTDPEPAVRLAAARQLAERGDKRVLPVLRAIMKSGGPEAVSAYGLLRQLGEKIATPDELASLLTHPSTELRMGAIEAFAALPAELAVPLLSRAARDTESLVRRLVVEVAADLPAPSGPSPGEPVVRALTDDPDVAVRARAQAVLARLLLSGTSRPGEPAPAARPPAAAPRPALALATEAAPAANPSQDEPAGSRGLLLVKGSEQVRYQLDEQPLQSIGSRPIALSPGAHRLVCLGGKFDVQIAAGQTTTILLPDSARERAARDGIAAFQRSDFTTAHRLLERASRGCERERRLPQACASLLAEVSFYRARIFEAEHRRAEAANEYQRVLDSNAKPKSAPAQRLAAQAALAALAPRLGQVVLRTKVKGRCRESMFWLEPGKQSVSIGGRSQEVTVKARQRLELGGCS